MGDLKSPYLRESVRHNCDLQLAEVREGSTAIESYVEHKVEVSVHSHAMVEMRSEFVKAVSRINDVKSACLHIEKEPVLRLDEEGLRRRQLADLFTQVMDRREAASHLADLLDDNNSSRLS